MPASGFVASAAVGVLLACAVAVADTPPPEVVAAFTRRVQPLLVNRCAAGACHGGPAGHEPRLERGPGSGRPDAASTRANMRKFLDAVGSSRDAHGLVAMMADGHPARRSGGGPAVPPLTVHERRTIEAWLADVAIAEASRRDGAAPAAAVREDAAPRRNRFRDLLDAAASPVELEPPREPRGAIFALDDGLSAQPPPVPSPP